MARRTKILVASLLVSVGIAAPAAEAAKTKKITSVVEVTGMNFVSEPPFDDRIVGDVHASKPKCERNREVTVYRTPEGEARELVGTATTDRTGDWEVFVDNAYEDAVAYDATVSRRKIKRPGKDIVCKPDESPALTINPLL